MRIRDEEFDEIGVPLAPLIDIVFLLLIFFLVGTVLKEPTKEMWLQVPAGRGTDAVPQGENPVLVIGVDAQGIFFLNGERATRTELNATLDRMARTSPGDKVRLDVDQRAPILAFAEVLKALEVRDLKHFGIRANQLP